MASKPGKTDELPSSNGEITEPADHDPANGRFRRGNRASRGRPPGARNRATLAAERLLDGEAEAITRRCIEMALAGDPVALRLAMERLLPPRRSRPVHVSLPPIETPRDGLAAISAIVRAVGAGELTPDEAEKVAAPVAAVLKAFEVVDLERRLAALEERFRHESETPPRRH